jgi:hypothetical protein
VSELARWGVSAGDGVNVQWIGVSDRQQFARRAGGCLDGGAVGVDLVWTEDSGAESFCEGNYAVALDIPTHISEEDFELRVLVYLLLFSTRERSESSDLSP